ncbi:CDP-glycerol glycerophosphotransferase family protein [Alteribacter aurantiacus]|uniref:CDP-glycerol glycerophosphotransferase family protein n=1 Tax=Alteribacter aurantiacus TaxID=254410 RepID=UPI00041E7808|nr:CDP-glycerol glycerophosphotransferase family protein [Alteribacter aurantiacus]
MNHQTFKAYELTHHFFKVFKNVTYKDVPIARVLTLNFYRIFALPNYGLLETKDNVVSEVQTRKLYNLVFDDENVVSVQYSSTKALPSKVIFSRFVDKISFDKRNGIYCDEYIKSNDERPPYVNPTLLVSANRKAYKRVVEKVNSVLAKKSIPPVLKQQKFKDWFLSQMEHVIRLIDGLEKIFSENNIRGAVQESTLLPMNYIILFMCKQRKIPTINLQLFLNSHYQLMSMNSDYYVVFGQKEVDRMSKYGVPQEKLIKLGNGRFDTIFTRKWMNKEQLVKKMKVPRGKIILLYAEQPVRPATVNVRVMKAMISALSPFSKKIILLVKKHPRQPQSTFTPELLKKFKFIKVVNENTHLYDLISGSDCILTQFSCVGLEAILFNKQMISVCFFEDQPSREHSYFATHPDVTSARDSLHLRRIVGKYISSQAYRKKIFLKQNEYRKYIYPGKVCTPDIQAFIKEKTGVKI